MPSSTSVSELAKVLGTARAPLLLDVRPERAFEAGEHLVAGAIWRSPKQLEQWCDHLPRDRPVLVYCVHGHEVSQGVASTLESNGISASYLAGGFAAWSAQNLPLRRKRGPGEEGPSTWVTRERPKIDRIACPWLIRRFIDPDARFVYVPADRVMSVAKETGATPYDVAGVEFTHEGERCSFDTFLRIYGIVDPALDHLATIVRGADTSRHDLSPQCGGLFAISLGMSANFSNDHEMLEQGMVMYDALYTWCRSLQAETHNWPATSLKRLAVAELSVTEGVRYAPRHGVSLREAFWVWLRVAMLSVGGPAAQIAVMHRMLVEEKRWISESRFLYALNYCMLLPGPEAKQLAIYTGWLMHRTVGGIMAGTLFVVPGIVSIMALSYVYAAYGNVPLVVALFFGLKAAVLAIVLEAVFRIGNRALKNNAMRVLAAAAFMGIFFFNIPFPLIVLTAALIGFVGAASGTDGLSFDVPVLTSVNPWALALSVAAIIAIFRFKVGMITTLLACAAIGIILYLAGLQS